MPRLSWRTAGRTLQRQLRSAGGSPKRLDAHVSTATFDPDPLFREFARTKFDERYGIEARLVIEEFRAARLQLHPFILWHREQHPDAPFTPDSLAEFHQIDKWAYTPPEYHLNRR